MSDLIKKRIEALSPTENKPVFGEVSMKALVVTPKSPPAVLPKPKGRRLMSPKVARTLCSPTSPKPASRKFANSHGDSTALDEDTVNLADKEAEECISVPNTKKEPTLPLSMQNRPSVNRSASVGTIDKPDGEDSFRLHGQEISNDASRVPGMVEPDVTPTLSSYEEAQSDRVAYFTAKGILRSNSLRSPPNNTTLKYAIATPTPYKPISSKLSLPKRVRTPGSWERDCKDKRYASTSSLLFSPVAENYEPPARHDYANTSREEPVSPGTKQNSSASTVTNTPSPKPRLSPHKRTQRDDSINTGAYQNIGIIVNNGSGISHSPLHGSVCSGQITLSFTLFVSFGS